MTHSKDATMSRIYSHKLKQLLGPVEVAPPTEEKKSIIYPVSGNATNAMHMPINNFGTDEVIIERMRPFVPPSSQITEMEWV